MTISGQIIVENAGNGDDDVDGDNEVRGNVTITYNGSLGGIAGFTVSAWREVR